MQMILHWSVFDEEEELGPVLDYYINWCDKGNVDRFQKSGIPQLCFCHFDKRKANRVKWDMWTDQICTKSQQRMFHLKKLLTFQVSSKVLQKFIVLFSKVSSPFLSFVSLAMPHRHKKESPTSHITMQQMVGLYFTQAWKASTDRGCPPPPSFTKKTKHFPLCLRLLKSLTAEALTLFLLLISVHVI